MHPIIRYKVFFFMWALFYGNRLPEYCRLIMILIISCITIPVYYRLFDAGNHICSFLHVNVSYARYLETFKWQNVVYTLHGVC
jgi:hypothetical protein